MHTKGPWTVRTAQNLTAIVTPKGEIQMSLHGTIYGLKPMSVDLHEWMANARLIAAAPELLDALKEALANDPWHAKGCDASQNQQCNCYVSRAKALIAKAEHG
jgi:hypothetical protein